MTPQNDPWAEMARWGRTGEVPHGRFGYEAHYHQEPWAPPKKSNTARNVLIVIAVLVAVTLAACFGAVGLLAPTVAPTKAASQGAAAPSPLGIVPSVHAVGDEFEAGPFRYRVHGVETGITSAGEQTYGAFKMAQGQFVRLDLSVTNLGDRPNLFDSELYLKVIDTEQRVFSADASANLFGNGDQNGWLTEINPGNSIRAFVFFDLPVGAAPEKLEITEDMFGLVPDATVTLR